MALDALYRLPQDLHSGGGVPPLPPPASFARQLAREAGGGTAPSAARMMILCKARGVRGIFDRGPCTRSGSFPPLRLHAGIAISVNPRIRPSLRYLSSVSPPDVPLLFP